MEDHREAYFYWKEMGLRGATCVHVDAHLDVSNFKMPQHEVSNSNFLFYACQEGIVAHLVWVVPADLGQADLLDWLHKELPGWTDLTEAEFRSLRRDDGRVEGELAGARFTVCRSDRLPALDAPVILDIDIDYYLDVEDRIWQSPADLQRQLALGELAALNVAYSVRGGYTPLHLRYLAELSQLVFTGQEELAERLRLRLDSPELLSDWQAPAWLRAAAFAQRARLSGNEHEGSGWEAAAALDPDYRVRWIDVASFYLQRKQLAPCLQWLERILSPDDEPATLLAGRYIAGLAAFRCATMERAAQEWEAGLALAEGLSDSAMLRHLSEMQGRALFALGRLPEAAARFRRAIGLDGEDAGLWRQLARCLTGAEAADCYRTSLRLGPGLWASVQAREELIALERTQPL